MSDRFYPIKLPHLLKWILEEKGKSNSILGVSKELIFNISTLLFIFLPNQKELSQALFLKN